MPTKRKISTNDEYINSDAYRDGPLLPYTPYPEYVPTPFIPYEIPPFERQITNDAVAGQKIPLIYGPCKVPGKIIYKKVTNVGTLLVVYLLGWGELDAITSASIAGESVASWTVKGVLDYYAAYVGSSTQVIDPRMDLREPNWVSRLPGLAYVVMEFKVNDTVANVQPPDERDVMFYVRGRKVRDPRTDATLVNYYYRDNVSLVRADTLTFKYAGAMPDANVDWSGSITESANDCDVDIGVSQKRFSIGIYIAEKRPWKTWQDILRLHAQMFDTYNNGKYQMYVDKAQSASGIVLTDQGANANIIRGWFRQKGASETPSKVTFNFTNVSADYKPDSATSDNPSTVASGLELLPKVVDTMGVPVYYQAKNLSIWALNRSSLDKEYFFECTYEAIQILPGIVVTVTSDDVDVSGQQMIVTDVKPNGLTFLVHCELYSSAVYSNVISTTPAIAPPASDQSAFTPPDPGIPVLVEQKPIEQDGATGSYVVVTFTRPANYGFYDKTRLTVTRTKTGEPTTVFIAGEVLDGPIRIPNTMDNATYVVKAQTVSTYGAVSAGVDSLPLTTTVKTTPPGDITYMIAKPQGDEVEIVVQKPVAYDPNFKYELRWMFYNDIGVLSLANQWQRAKLIDQYDKLTVATKLPFGKIRLYARSVDSSQQYSVGITTHDFTQFPLESTPSEITKNLELSALTLASDGFWADTNLFVEGITTRGISGKNNILLSRSFSPAAANAEIVAGGYANISAWMTAVEAPRTKGVGHWAPLPSPLVAHVTSFAGSLGAFLRNRRYQVRAGGNKTIGIEGINKIAEAWPFSLQADGSRLWGEVFFLGPTGGQEQWGITLSTNDPYFQNAFIDTTAFIKYTYIKQRVPIAPYFVDITTDSNGDATYTLPTPLAIFTLVHVTLDIIGNSTVEVFLVSRSNTAFTIKTLQKGTNTNAGSITVRAKLEDWGEGGALASFTP